MATQSSYNNPKDIAEILPLDVLHMIFVEFMSDRTVRALPLVSKSWKKMSANLRVRFRSGAVLLTGGQLRSRCRLFPSCEELHLADSNRLVPSDLYALSALKCLRHLRLSYLNAQENMKVVCSLGSVVSSLQSLSIAIYQTDFEQLLVPSLELEICIAGLSSFRNLREVRLLSYPIFEAIRDMCDLPLLTILELRDALGRAGNSEKLPKGRIGKLCRKLAEEGNPQGWFARLETLIIDGEIAFSQTDMDAVCSVRNLKHLELHAISYDERFDFMLPSESVITQMTSLTHLSLRAKRFSYEDALHCFATLTALKRLSLKSKKSHGDDEPCLVSLREFAKHVPQLEEIDLDYEEFTFSTPFELFSSLRKAKLVEQEDTKMSDAQFSQLTRCGALNVLKLSLDDTLTTASVEVIATLSALETLSIKGSFCEDTAFLALAQLHNLHSLTLANVEVDEDVLEAVVQANAHLSHLRLRSLNSLSSLRCVTCAPSLQDLEVRGSALNDDSISYVTSLRGLQSLALFETLFTGVGLRGALFAETLTSLEFGDSTISLEGAKVISRFKRLRGLQLESAVAPEVFAELLRPPQSFEHLNATGLTEQQLALLLACPSLRSVQLPGCRGAANEAMIVNLCAELPALEYLYVQKAGSTMSIALVGRSHILKAKETKTLPYIPDPDYDN